MFTGLSSHESIAYLVATPVFDLLTTWIRALLWLQPLSRAHFPQTNMARCFCQFAVYFIIQVFFTNSVARFTWLIDVETCSPISEVVVSECDFLRQYMNSTVKITSNRVAFQIENLTQPLTHHLIFTYLSVNLSSTYSDAVKQSLCSLVFPIDCSPGSSGKKINISDSAC
jgi:hypothetical protein